MVIAVKPIKELVIILNKKIKSTLISLVLIGSVLGACNLPVNEVEDAGEEPMVGVQQEEASQANEQPFEELTPEEFFEMCDLAGGQVEQWGDSWACDF